MKTEDITRTINSHISQDDILRTEIEIYPENEQIASLKIIFKEYTNYSFTTAGALIDDIETLICQDEYGDLTECSLSMTTIHEEPNDKSYTLYLCWTITFGIDS